MQYFNLVAFVVCTIYKTMIELYICYAFNYAVCAIDGIYFEPPLCCWHAPGFKYLWRHHDSGQHQILKERCLKPLLKSTGNIVVATFAAFALVAYWHSPLPYFHESPRNEFLKRNSSDSDKLPVDFRLGFGRKIKKILKKWSRGR